MAKMATSIEEVAATAENLSASADEIVASMEETSKSVEGVAKNADRITEEATAAATAGAQLDRSIRSVVSVSQQARETGARVAREAEEGGATVQRSIQGLTRVRDSMGQSAQVIREMGKRAADISTIVDTIDLIAERTNLLSLNASIEAARAGDAGRGFAVVAEEIRNLADRSAKATADIAAIIKSLQEIVQEAVAASNEGLRVADESGRMSEEGATALKRILTGIHENAQFVSQ